MESNQANNSIGVISPQYCTPYQVDLYFAKKVKNITEGRHLGVFGIDGNHIFRSSCRISKACEISPHQRWKAHNGDSSDSKDLLFTIKKSKYLQLKIELDVFLASNTTENVCDFKIKQNYSEKSCVIYRGDSDNIIAEVHKNKISRDKIRGKDRFSATVYPDVDYAFVIAMRAVLNEINTLSRAGGGSGGTVVEVCGGDGCGGGG
ncbi:protein LURP-one-related 15-like [Papaver somniferum]|uniref:protein LURP-one-related 15-like n=1 Tax=Papaver somniferum TaxID=3469 RepID=UPI000E6F8667|nr:protein LURP-one-related 15-like [Papaver somniferum]